MSRHIVQLRTAPAGAHWLVYARGRGGFDYMPVGTFLMDDERLLFTNLTLAEAISKVDELNHLQEVSP